MRALNLEQVNFVRENAICLNNTLPRKCNLLLRCLLVPDFVNVKNVFYQFKYS